MRKEGQPLSLPELEQERDKLAHILAQRQDHFEVVGSFINPHNSLERDLSIARARYNLFNSIGRYTVALDTVSEQLAFLGPAQEYLDEVERTREQLDQLRNYAANDSKLVPAIERHTAAFKTLAARPGREPQLKEAIAILKQERAEREPQSTTPEERKPTLGINAELGNFWINGLMLERLYPRHKIVLKELAKNPGVFMSRGDLSHALHKVKPGDDRLRDQSMGDIIRGIRNAIKQLNIPELNPSSVIEIQGSEEYVEYRLKADVVLVDKDGKPIGLTEARDSFPVIPEEVLNKLTPAGRKAVAVLPFLSALPLPPEFGVTLEVPTRALHPKMVHATPNDREWNNTKKLISDARRVLGGDGYIIWSYRATAATQNRFFVTTTAIAQELGKLRKPPESTPKNVVYTFPNGEKLSLRPEEVTFASTLVYYPQRGVVSGDDLVDKIYGEAIQNGAIERRKARGRKITTLTELVRNKFLKAGVAIINTTPPTEAERFKGSHYFAVAVHRGELLSDTESLTGPAVVEEYIRHRGLLNMEELERSIFADQIRTMTPDEHQNIKPIWARRIMAEFAAQYVRAIRGENPELLERINGLTGNVTRTRQEQGRLMTRILTSIAKAEYYFFVQDKAGVVVPFQRGLTG